MSAQSGCWPCYKQHTNRPESYKLHTKTSYRIIQTCDHKTLVFLRLKAIYCPLQLRDRGRRICNDLKVINTWNEIITETTYDMTEVLVVMESIEKRLELWRYYDVCTNRIKDWTNNSFIKVHNIYLIYEFKYHDYSIMIFVLCLTLFYVKFFS